MFVQLSLALCSQMFILRSRRQSSLLPRHLTSRFILLIRLNISCRPHINIQFIFLQINSVILLLILNINIAMVKAHVSVLTIFVFTILHLGIVGFLVYQTETIIVIEFGDGEIYFDLVVEFFVGLDTLKQPFSKSSNNTLLIVIYNILKELIDKFDFEIGQIKPSIIIRVELIGNIQNYFVFFAFVSWVYEFMD